MPNYATSSQLMARLGSEVVGNLSLPAMPMNVPEYLDMIIEEGEGIINAYLSAVYAVPIVTDASNSFLRNMTLDMAEYEVWKRALGNDVPVKYKDSVERVMKILDDIKDGKIAPFPTKAKNISMSIETDTPMFNESSMNNYF